MANQTKLVGTYDHSALGKALKRPPEKIASLTTAQAMQAGQEAAATDWAKNAPRQFRKLLEAQAIDEE